MLAVALGTIACSSDHMGTGPVATRLVFSGQRSAATAGVVITPGIQVTALDAGGVVGTPFSGTITIALAANTEGATLLGTLSRGAIGGVATFGFGDLPPRSENCFCIKEIPGSCCTHTTAIDRG